MKIGFIGLGVMGKPMALNLLKTGNEVTVYDVKTTAFDECRAKGAKTTTELSVVAKSDVIFLSLPNSKVVESVFYGKNGLLDYLYKGQSIVDLSTINYSTTVRLAKKLTEMEIGFLDAPVSGMEARAVEGTLTVMCGGTQELYDRILPLFKCIANKCLFMGQNGNGQLTKLINQLLFDINAAALAEILPMAIKKGLDPEKVGEVVNSGTGRSFASEFFIPRTLKGIFNDGYAMASAYKDLVSAAELGASEGIPLPVLAAATVTYQMALLRGHGNCAKGAMIKVYEDFLGVAFRKKESSETK
jgi:3-hydroxyisobutyrate dehydrogenase-like beta-hydroxyacid dehydrogenase